MFELPVEGSYNARAIGLPERPWLLRSASLDGLTANGEAALRAHGVDLVIDLREPVERRARHHLLEVHSVPLYGEEPPAAGTLEGVYLRLLEERGIALSRAVIAIAEHPGVALVHCTAGKDRTGLVVALARLAAGNDRAEVVHDYTLSGAAVRPARSEVAAAQLGALGLSDEDRAAAERLHLDSPADALNTALAFIDSQGGAAAYLLRHGTTHTHLAALVRRASEPAQSELSDHFVPACAYGAAAAGAVAAR